MVFGQTKVQKIATCLCCSPVACLVPWCIDEWWGIEACGLAYLNFGHCCWISLAPTCFKCELGDCKKGVDYCVEGFKYFFVAFILEIIGICDGGYNCGNFVVRCIKHGATSFD